MDIEWGLLLPLLAVLVLAVLITGPGMWSDAWGWWWMKKPEGRGGGDARPRPPSSRHRESR